MILRQSCIDPLGARKPTTALASIHITPLAQLAAGLGLRKQLLPEKRHLRPGMRLVVLDQLRQRARPRTLTCLEITVEPILELELQNDLLVSIELVPARNSNRINQHRTSRTQRAQRLLKLQIHLLVKPGELPHNADAHTSEALRIEKARVIDRSPVFQR